MTEEHQPTIDECLSWFRGILHYLAIHGFTKEVPAAKRIIVILEQHREPSLIEMFERLRAIPADWKHRPDLMGDVEKIRKGEDIETTEQWKQRLQLEAIRAFVERADARLTTKKPAIGCTCMLHNYFDCVKDELAAMEKETNG